MTSQPPRLRHTSVHEWRLTSPTIVVQKCDEVVHHLPIKKHEHLKSDPVNPNIVGHPRDPFNLPPKQRAASFRNWPLLRALLQDNSNNEPTPTHLLHDAVVHGAPVDVLRLIVQKLDPNDNWAETVDGASQNPLHSAILCHAFATPKDQHEAILFLVQAFPDACLHFNINGALPIHLASFHGGMPKIVKLLCDTCVFHFWHLFFFSWTQNVVQNANIYSSYSISIFFFFFFFFQKSGYDVSSRLGWPLGSSFSMCAGKCSVRVGAGGC